jgi:hypothetical protein
MKNNYLKTISVVKVAFLFLISINTQAQNDYSVAAIPYQVYTATAPVQGTSDDTFSEPIPLGFDFDFYGNTYNQVNVSTNGYISFTPQVGGSLSPWQFNSTIPNADFNVKNAFLGCFHDLNNSVQSGPAGTLTYAVLGSAPYRKFVVLFDNQAHFSCAEIKSTFQMILYETLNIMDVQLIDKQVCTTWNNGLAVTGIIDQTGLLAVTAPNRNISSWTASQEGWRFQRPYATGTYLFAKCDDDTDGIVTFNLQVAQNDLSSANPSLVSFYSNDTDAISQTNALTNLNYTNIAVNTETLYANVNGEVKSVVLRVIDCNSDYDLDSVDTANEDLNADTNLANDDTDLDGIPNFIDNDDDGDLIITNVEYVFTRSAGEISAILDTDGDTIPNYLDNDDDGDGLLTVNEDYNNNNNPADDDTNGNAIPDYLENSVFLGVGNFDIQNEVTIYPNPASSVLNIDNRSSEGISAIAVYNLSGSLVDEVKSTTSLQSISVAALQSGIYFIKIQMKSKVINYKFIKK